MALTKMNDNPSRKTSSAVARCRVAALMLAVIAIAFALREHWGHIFGLNPYLLLLACPLMHLFAFTDTTNTEIQTMISPNIACP